MMTKLHKLHWSIQEFYGVSFIKLLLEDGAHSDINVRNLKGEMPLHLALKREKCSVKLIDLLLKYGADVKATTPRDGNTALHWLFNTQNNPVQEDITMAVKLLFEYGSDVNAVNLKGETPLHLVVRKKGLCQLWLIRLLLANGADVTITDAIGENVFQANITRDTILPLLLLPVNERLEHKITPLHVACLLHEFESVHKLLKLGADVNAKNSYNKTPLYYAFVTTGTSTGTAELCLTLKLLLDYGADINKALSNVTFVSFDRRDLRRNEMRIMFYQHKAKLSILNEKQIDRDIKFEFPSPADLDKYLRSSLEYYDFFDTEKNETEYSKWLSLCSEEVKLMSETKIGNSKVSFLDLLLASAKMTRSYAKNKEHWSTRFKPKRPCFRCTRGCWTRSLTNISSAKSSSKKRLWC